ncbi:type I-E CRISPR-associated protein Cse2/CasB [Methylobacter sp. YRD-M1]|uniref:type I-E CRISPR-associated protein Cse2/CasB n=1 Tax=Methylobacter sp. YRD-M1 TaxID=2911520 RepID=UPI00227B0206|nr:type I-E CRISPR-associated protein Cse2/CasB [Methylobacter sp. YRD-M1]WAK03951.1 type I-E CRISPR-associated protein Cse2/CasB [Methylobacter sp. YRD-M1]
MSELNTAEKQLQSWHAWLGGNRGDRARLRRAESPEDILLTDAFFHFLEKMDQADPGWSQQTPMLASACIAGALSHVKTDKQTPSWIHNGKDKTDAAKKIASFAEQLATPPEGKNKAPMSELRFQQLQKSPTIDDFYRRIIRAIRLLDGNVNVVSLANDIIHWHQEFNQPFGRHPAKRLAVRWATDYFTALPKNKD